MRATWLGLLLFAACAARSAAPSNELGQLSSWEAQSKRLEQELRSAEVGATVDCPRACSLKNAICELTDRICTVADRHPEETDIRVKCQDAKGRCERARTKVDHLCNCGV